MEEGGDLFIEDNNASRGVKGKSLGDLRRNMLLPRKKLSDISNLPIKEIGNGIISGDQKYVKNGSPLMANEYIAKLLTENNILMRALTERNAEMKILGLKLTKFSQQNCLLALTNSQMLTELNLVKDKLRISQHEIGCTSAVLKEKTRQLEELKKMSTQSIQMQKNTILETTKPQVVESAFDKKTCLPNQKRLKRSQSLGPACKSADQATSETLKKNQRKPLRKSSFVTVDSDLLQMKDESRSLNKQVASSSPRIRIKEEEEEEERDQFSSPRIRIKEEEEEEERGQFSGNLRKPSIGRPTRRATLKVNSYKEMNLNTKLRRNE